MSRRIIPCMVTDEYVRGAGVVVGAAGSHNDVALRLEFGSMWAGTSRSIVWKDALGGNATVTVLGTDLLVSGESEVYLVPIPAEPKKYAGELSMTIKGASVSGETETSATLTATAHFIVMESDWDENAGESGDITPTVAEQLQAEIDDIKETIVSAGVSEERAKASEEAAKSSEQKAAQASAAAESAKSTAQQAASTATQQASAAARSRSAIENMSVSSETVTSGGAASVTKSMVGGSVHLHFGLPRGEKGATGAPGARGAQGVQGVPGEQGPRGINGTAVSADGIYAFNVNAEGHLVLSYTGDTAPTFSINDAGHLILTL